MNHFSNRKKEATHPWECDLNSLYQLSYISWQKYGNGTSRECSSVIHLSMLSPRGWPWAHVGHLTFLKNFWSKSPPRGPKIWSNQIKYTHLENEYWEEEFLYKYKNHRLPQLKTAVFQGFSCATSIPRWPVHRRVNGAMWLCPSPQCKKIKRPHPGTHVLSQIPERGEGNRGHMPHICLGSPPQA